MPEKGSARVLAIAAVHERLYTGADARGVRLDTFLNDLAQDIGTAYGCPEGIEANIEEVTVPTDMAIPLALIVNGLVTNAVKYVGPPCAIGVRVAGSAVKLTVAEKAQVRGGCAARPRVAHDRRFLQTN